MVEIIAHRGASRDALENTLAAFRVALDQGADALELDVHATADGVVVVHHDPAVRHVTGPVAIRHTRHAALPAIGPHAAERIPTLDEVLLLAGGQATVYVEVKAVGIEGLVVDALDRHPAVRTAVHAFDHRIPVEVRRRRAGTPIGLLSASYPLDLAAMLGEAPPDALWQHVDVLDAALVDAAHRRGARVIAWTVNDPARARELIGAGVDALCTDTPGALRAALAT